MKSNKSFVLPFAMAAALVPVSARSQTVPAFRWLAPSMSSDVSQIAVSPNGLFFARAGYYADLQVYTAQNNALVLSRKFSDYARVAFSPDSRTLAVADYHGVSAFDVFTGQRKWEFPLTNGRGLYLAFATDGSRIFVGGPEERVSVLSANGKPLMTKLFNADNQAKGLVVSPDGATVSLLYREASSSLQRIRVLKALNLGAKIDFNAEESVSIAVSKDSKVFYTNEANGKIWKFTAATGGKNLLATSTAPIVSMALLSTGTKLVYGTDDGMLHGISTTGTPYANKKGWNWSIEAIAGTTSEGDVLVQGSSSPIFRVSPAGLIRLGVAALPPNRTRVMKFLSTGAGLAAGDYYGCLTVLNASTGAVDDSANVYNSYNDTVSIDAIASGGGLMAFATGDEKVYLGGADLSSLQSFAVPYRPVDMLFSADATKLICGGSDNAVRVFDLATLKQVQKVSHADSVTAMAMNEDGQVLATGDYGGRVKLWSATGALTLLRTLELKATTIDGVDVTRDGLYVAVRANGVVDLHRVSDGIRFKRIAPVGTYFHDAHFTPDGQYLAISDDEGDILFYSVPGGGLVYTMWMWEFWPTKFRFSPSGDSIAVQTYYDDLAVVGNPMSSFLAGFASSGYAVYGGESINLGLMLSAPSAGGLVTLQSTANAAFVRDSVAIAAGSTYEAVPAFTRPVSTPTTVRIQAGYNGQTVEFPILILPPTLSSMTLLDSSVKGGSGTEASVVLTGLAPLGGTTVTLSCDTPGVTVPATVKVNDFEQSEPFIVTTTAVTVKTQAKITAKIGPVIETRVLTINP